MGFDVLISLPGLTDRCLACTTSQGADRLLLAMFNNNYDLCARNNLAVIEDLIRMLSSVATWTQASIECLQCLAVVKGIPVHRNQQQILQSLVTHNSLHGLHKLASLSASERQRLLAILDLVNTCCVGHYAYAQTLAQGLVPLPMMLKAIGTLHGLRQLNEQEALLRCLREVWWTSNMVSDSDQVHCCQGCRCVRQVLCSVIRKRPSSLAVDGQHRWRFKRSGRHWFSVFWRSLRDSRWFRCRLRPSDTGS